MTEKEYESVVPTKSWVTYRADGNSYLITSKDFGLLYLLLHPEISKTRIPFGVPYEDCDLLSVHGEEPKSEYLKGEEFRDEVVWPSKETHTPGLSEAEWYSLIEGDVLISKGGDWKFHYRDPLGYPWMFARKGTSLSSSRVSAHDCYLPLPKVHSGESEIQKDCRWNSPEPRPYVSVEHNQIRDIYLKVKAHFTRTVEPESDYEFMVYVLPQTVPYQGEPTEYLGSVNMDGEPYYDKPKLTVLESETLEALKHIRSELRFVNRKLGFNDSASVGILSDLIDKIENQHG